MGKYGFVHGCVYVCVFAAHTPGQILWDHAARSQAASPSCHCSGENELTCVYTVRQRQR